MEEAYSNLNNAYLQIKGMIVVEGFYALVAGFVITTFVFKLAGIIKEMVHEGKGFNAKQFYELGREYILCIALICIMPVLLDTLETVLAYAADRLMESLAAGGVYNPDNIWKKPIEQAFDDLMNSDIIDIAVNGLDTTFNSLLAGAVGSFGGVAYDYLMLVFLCTRYLILILLEVISPLAIACLYNSDTRSSFYTWARQMVGCYMLYPGFVIASVFSDLIVVNYVQQRPWSITLMVIFSFLLKLAMLATVKATVNKWYMMDIKNILKDFSRLAEARKNHTFRTRLVFIFCAATIAMVLFFSYRVVNNAMNKILVVNEGGELLRFKAMQQDLLYESLLKNHCYHTAYYLNSFDRLSLQENRARALFLVNKPDANTIFAKYQADRGYGDALELGVVYRTEFEKMLSVSVSGDEYHVTFSSVLSIINGNDVRKIRILSEGTVIRTTPRFPENTSGFFFRTYNQQYEMP